jgi:predicted RNA polymerase sigma factor
MDDTIGDDLLRLVFIACHPVLSTEARDTDVAAAGRVDDRRNCAGVPGGEATIAQRTFGERRWPRRRFRLKCRAGRVHGAVVFCFAGSLSHFNEGYSATSGDDWLRPSLCEGALRLGRILAGWFRMRRRCMDWWR